MIRIPRYVLLLCLIASFSAGVLVAMPASGERRLAPCPVGTADAASAPASNCYWSGEADFINLNGTTYYPAR